MTPSSVIIRFLIIFQYLPRLYLVLPLSYQIVKANGVVTETAWAGAAYNLMLYMLASHVSYFYNLDRKFVIQEFLHYLKDHPTKTSLWFMFLALGLFTSLIVCYMRSNQNQLLFLCFLSLSCCSVLVAIDLFKQ